MIGISHLDKKHLHVVLCIGGVMICTKFGYNIIIKLSMSGKSKNYVVKFFHNLLRPFFNCGFLMRREFFVKLPSHPICLTKKSYVIVNYGSYGTVPIKVQQYQFNVQKELEYCPDLFNRLTLHKRYEQSRVTVASAVGCEPDNLVFVENLTEAITCSLRSLLSCLKKNDAVLCLRSVAYGAVVKAIDVLANEYHIDVVDLDLQFPLFSKNDILIKFEEIFLNYPCVKLAVFDHITSASSVVLPIKELGEICRKYNVISVVDGAHAPGQLYLNIDSYNVDVYLGNLHKWYYTPKSCAIMCVNKKWHDKMKPSWISHATYGGFQERFFMQGTKNYSAMVSAGYAVNEFTECIGGLDHLHSYIPPLIEWVVKLYISKWETEEVQIPADMKAPYMRTVYLPDIFTEVYGNAPNAPANLMKEFLEEENVAVVILTVQNRMATRVSAQIFSTKREFIIVANLIKKKADELRVQCL
ncbi:uncharacterized protein LOC100214466 isoform X2 [Hydra vulgaris]|uniref:Uncharacterized protein LOC100214466 isoform X2 n=1 Tax=Hydra vulgaris TaxID=6087 RepID=A0ABM4DIV3_HYDVU